MPTCPYCGMDFSNDDEMMNHGRQAHPDQMRSQRRQGQEQGQMGSAEQKA